MHVPSAPCHAVLLTLSLFLLAGCGSDGKDDPCAEDPCGTFCAGKIECTGGDQQECLSECASWGTDYQDAYCICFKRMYDKYGCDFADDEEIVEGELSECMRQECPDCVL